MKSSMPHANVFARLGRSNIQGIGVIAIKNIPKGTDIFPDVNDEITWIDQKRITSLPSEMKRLYKDFCIAKGAKYGCPDSFNKINITWYLNHSERPNSVLDEGYRIIAARDIRKGEEITTDYRLYMDMKIPSNWKK
jgi:SET domain-containing protein